MRRLILPLFLLLFAGSLVAGCDRLTGPSPKGPIILNFAADASSLILGQCTVLRWEVSGATSVAIWPEVGDGRQAKGSAQVCPKASTTYTLTAAATQATVTAFAAVALR